MCKFVHEMLRKFVNGLLTNLIIITTQYMLLIFCTISLSHAYVNIFLLRYSIFSAVVVVVMSQFGNMYLVGITVRNYSSKHST